MRQITSILMLLIVSVGIAHAQTPVSRNTEEGFELRLTNLLAKAHQPKRTAFSLMPESRVVNVSEPSFTITPMAAGANVAVMGGGTPGRLTKWTGFTSANSFIGDTTIFEDKFGKVGVGTDMPTSKLTVAGTIEAISGGVKFPDGTLQTTAGIAPTDVVRSLNGLKGAVTLAATSPITIVPSGNTLTIAAPNVLTAVAHDATLTGNGTQASPLGVASPLEVRDVTKTLSLADQFITATDIDLANNPVVGPIDASGTRSVRILVVIGTCSPCSNVNVSVESDANTPIDVFSVGAANAVSRVYEIPGTQLRVRVGNATPNASNQLHIIILGRSN